MDGHRLPFNVPVDEHAAAAVPGVPLGEDVLVERAEVGRVGGDRGRPGAPDRLGAGGERGVGDLDGDGPGHLGGQVPAAHVPDVVLAVPGLCVAGDGADAGVGAVGVDGQQQPLGQHVRGQVSAAGRGGDRVQAAGAQHRLLEHVDQRHGAPPGADLGLEPPKVPRLRCRVQVGELDRALLAPVGDLQPRQFRQRRVQRGELVGHLAAQLVDERGRIQRLAQRGVVRDPVRLEVDRQVLVGVAPPVGAGHPDFLAPQLVPQCLEHSALVHGALDALASPLVGAVQQLLQVGRDDAVDRHPLAWPVVLDCVGGLAAVPLDQLQGLDHRPVGRVRGVEVQGLDQLDQAVPVVAGVGRLEYPLLVLAEA